MEFGLEIAKEVRGGPDLVYICQVVDFVEEVKIKQPAPLVDVLKPLGMLERSCPHVSISGVRTVEIGRSAKVTLASRAAWPKHRPVRPLLSAFSCC